MKILPLFVGNTEAKMSAARFELLPEPEVNDAADSSYEDVRIAMRVCFGGGFFGVGVHYILYANGGEEDWRGHFVAKEFHTYISIYDSVSHSILPCPIHAGEVPSCSIDQHLRT